MDNSKELKRIYRIEVQGIEDATKKVTQLNQEINLQTQIKKEAQKILLANPGDVNQIEKQSKVIADSEIAIKKLTAEKRIAIKEADALITAQERIAKAEIQVAQNNDIAAGSYKALFAESKKLNELYRSTSPTDPMFEKIKASAIEAQQRVHDFNRTLASDGTLVGEYSKGIINAFKSNDMGEILKAQVQKSEAALKQLDQSMLGLKQEYNDLKKAGGQGLDEIEKKLVENRQAALKLEEQVGAMKSEMKSVGGVGSQLTSELKSGFQNVTSEISHVALQFIGLQAAIHGVQTAIHTDMELSDSLADLEIRLKGDKQAADEVFDSLKKLDTRTSLGELVDTASLVAKKGVAKEEIAGITQALDNYFVVAGKEAGNREEGVASIVKLISIFNDDKHVTKQRVEEISASLIGLQNSGVATGAKMIDMAERIGSVRGMTGITLPNVLGFAAAIEQLGQRSEVAGTAGVQILTKMFADVGKYAKLSGIPIEELRKKLKDNPFEALVAVAEKLKDGKNFEQVAQDFEEIGVKGARVKTVIADIAGNADFVRKRMGDAAIAMANTASVADSAAIKQTTFAATVEKIRKQFELAGANQNFLALLNAIGNGILWIVKVMTAIPFGLVITGITLATAAWAYYKGNILATTIAQNWNNEATLLGTIRNWAARLGLLGAAEASRVKTVALAAETVATEEATVATEALNVATKSTPLGIILGVIALLIPAMSAFASSTRESSKAIEEQSDSLKNYKKFQDEIDVSIKEQTTKTKNAIDELVSIIKDENNSLELRKKAYEQLIQIAPEFTGTVDAEYRATDKLNKVYTDYIANLNKVARVKAIQATKQKYEDARATAEAEEFNAKLKKDQEDRDNDVIDQHNEQHSKEAQQTAANSSGYVDVSMAYHVYKEDKSTKANDYFKQKSAEAKKAKKDAEDFDKYMQTLSEEDRKALIGSIGTDGKTPPPSTGTGDDDKDKKKKSAEQIRDERINALKTEEDTKKKLLEIRYKTGKIDEIGYLEELNKINVTYADKKLAIVLKAGKAEANRIAEFQLDKINSEKDTNEKVYKLKKDALEKQFKEVEFKEDPKKSKSENAQVKIDVDNKNLEIAKNKQIAELALENQYHIKNIENENKWAEEIRSINEKLANDIVGLDKARLAELKTNGETELAKYKADMAAKRLLLVQQDKNTTKFDKAEKIGTLGLELKAMNDQLPQMKKLYEEGQISAKEYYDFLAERDKKAAELYKLNTEDVEKSFKDRLKSYKSVKDLIKGELVNSLTPKDENGQAKEGYEWIGESISQAFDIGKQAMNDYFDSQKQRIEEEKKFALDKLELEKDQKLSRAQSRAEEQSINRQFAKQKHDIEAKAFEEQKKLKKSEAKIALASELANIAVQAAANPANAATFGAAGLIQFAVLGALAAARYALRVGEINKEKFATGGWVTQGGEIVGPPHAQGGVPFNAAEAEGSELAIINKRSASSNDVYNVTGTAKQIASAINETGGGKRFAIGGKINKLEYGGSFGKQLSIPGDTSYMQNNGMKEAIEATNNRIDNIKVFVVSKEVEKANNKLNKAAEINTL